MDSTRTDDTRTAAELVAPLTAMLDSMNACRSFTGKMGLAGELQFEVEPGADQPLLALKIRKWLSWKDDFARHLVKLREELRAHGFVVEATPESKRTLFGKEEREVCYHLHYDPAQAEKLSQDLERRAKALHSEHLDTTVQDFRDKVEKAFPASMDATTASALVTELEHIVTEKEAQLHVEAGTVMKGPFAEHRRLLNQHVAESKKGATRE